VEAFPGATGRHGGFPKILPVRGAGLSLFKVLQIVRSAEIFQRRQALSGFSPERSGGSSGLKFFGFYRWPPWALFRVTVVRYSLSFPQRCHLSVGCYESGACCGLSGSFPGALCHGWLLPLVGLLPVLSREALAANPRNGGFPVRLPGSWRGLAAGNRFRFR